MEACVGLRPLTTTGLRQLEFEFRVYVRGAQDSIEYRRFVYITHRSPPGRRRDEYFPGTLVIIPIFHLLLFSSREILRRAS